MRVPLDALALPNWGSAALLTIDVQNDFTQPGAPAEIAGTRAVLPAIVRLLATFRALGLPIVHVVRLYARDGSDAEIGRRTFVRTRGPVVAPDTAGAELVDELKPDAALRLDAATLRSGRLQAIGPREWIAYKPRWGAFYGTPLEARLRDFGVDTVVVCGCNFPNCPRATLFGASERDFRTVVVADATSQVHERGLAEAASLGVSVFSTNEVLAALDGVSLTV